MKYVLGMAAILLVGCGMKHVRQDQHTEAGVVDYSNQRMRHGTVFMPPPKTEMHRRDETQISKGQAIYTAHCKNCHGTGGKGDGPYSKSMQPAPADLTKIAGRMPDIHFFIQIDAGPSEMPAWRDVLTVKEVQALTHYLQSLK